MTVPERDEFRRRSLMSDTDGIRQKSFRRLIYLSNLLQYDYEEDGPVKQAVIEGRGGPPKNYNDFLFSLQVSDLDDLAWAIQEVAVDSEGGDEEQGDAVAWFMDISDRTREDYLKTLRALYPG